MSQPLPHPHTHVPSGVTRTVPPASQTERFVLHGWILIIAAALLWFLLD
jgi:hypothetical protein